MSVFAPYLTAEQEAELKKVADAIVAPGKGILAADESTGTIGKRFDKFKLENIEENRRLYREMLFTAGTGGELSKCISGVIMFDETFYQKDSKGVRFVKVQLFKSKQRLMIQYYWNELSKFTVLYSYMYCTCRRIQYEINLFCMQVNKMSEIHNYSARTYSYLCEYNSITLQYKHVYWYKV